MVRTIDAKSRGGLGQGQQARNLQNRVRLGLNHTCLRSFSIKISHVIWKILILNALKRFQEEKIKKLEANVGKLNKFFEIVAQENQNTRKSVELTLSDRIKDTTAYVDRKFADVTEDLNKEPSLKNLLTVVLYTVVSSGLSVGLRKRPPGPQVGRG